MTEQGWRDKQGDVWTEGADGLMHTPETAPFPREYVERKWGPLQPARTLRTPDRDGRPGDLREAVERLAAKWVAGGISHDLRALLAEHPATPTEEPAHGHPSRRHAVEGGSVNAELEWGSLAHLIHDETDEPMWSAVVLAKRILASDWLRDHDAAITAKAKVEAWDEGHRLAAPHSDRCEPTCLNPYRADRITP